MNERKKILYAVLACALIALIASAAGIYLMYSAAIERTGEHLEAMAKTQARLIEAVARYDVRHTGRGTPRGELPQVTLDQVQDSFRQYEGIGNTGEFLLGRRKGKDMVYIAWQRKSETTRPTIVPSNTSMPMRLALSGQSGITITRDYRGVEVLAAYEAIKEFNLGVVAKIDLAEVRAPYQQAAAIATALAVLTVLLCAFLILRVTNPIIRRLQVSESRVRAIVDSAADAIITIDDQGLVESFNAAAERIFGYTPEEVVGQNVNMLMPEPYHSEHDSYLRNYHATGQPKVIGKGCSVTARRKGGVVFHVDLIINEMWLEGARKFVGIVRDTTEQVKAQEALRTSEQRFRSMFDGATEGIVFADTETMCFLMANQRWVTMLGYELGEVSRLSVPDIHPIDSHPHVFEQFRRMRDGKLQVAEDIPVRRKDGSIFHADISGSFVPVEGKKYLAGFFRDITERKRVELALRESELRYRNIVETAQEGIWQIDADSRTIFVNRKMADMLGYSVVEMEGQPLFAFMDEETKALAVQKVERRRQGIAEEHEFKFRRKDGSEMWALINTNPMFDEQSRYAGALAMVADMTERKRAQEALRESEANLAKAQEIAHIGSWSHDVLTSKITWSDELYRIFGLKPGEREPSFEMFMGFVHPEDRERMHNEVAESMHTGQPASFTYRIRRADGAERILLRQGQVFTNEAGKVARIFGVTQDVTDSMLSSAEKQKLSLALEQTADAVMITDQRGVIEYVNPAFETSTGFHKNEVLGHRPSLLKSGKQGPDFYKQLWTTILEGKAFSEVFVNRRKDGSLYYEEKTITPLRNERGTITHFVATGKDISERMQAQERLQFMAQHDVLTELPNRALFLDRLKQALARARMHRRLVAVLFLDLDRFKNINDTLGHQIGDLLLQEIALRFLKAVRDGDTVARLSGDEFAFLLEDVPTDDDISFIAEKILESLKPVFLIEGHDLFVSASIGVSLYPNDGEETGTLLRNADVAMYRAKDMGKNNYQFYSADMSVKAFERLSLESSLRRALEREEFLLYYQPQADVQTGKILGVEALLRWQHPDLGLVMPNDFIALLEENGLIVPVGEWVMHKACAQAHAWHKAGWDRLSVAVNLSARQFNAPGLVEMVERTTSELGFNRERLELEITESVIMRHAQVTIDALETLSRMGVQLAVDDFGTGYSSLSYLRRFPIDTLKIDSSFIRDIPHDPDDSAITTAIIVMAQSLKLKVVAEGVETEEQLRYLREHGCNTIQGYLFSKPLPAEEMTALLKKK